MTTTAGAPARVSDPATTSRPRHRRWSLRRWAAATAVAALLLSVAAIGFGTVAIIQLQTARDNVVNRIDPAIRASLNLINALVNEETGVRGYALSARDDFLAPYSDGTAAEAAAIHDLEAAVGGRYPQVITDLQAVQAAADRWRADYVDPTLAAVRTSGTARSAADTDRGKALFDQVRAAGAPLQADLGHLHAVASTQLDRAASTLTWTAIAIGVALLVGSSALAAGLTRGAIRPLTGLGTQVREVAGGEYTRPIRGDGPVEIQHLGADIDSMRQRVLSELDALHAANSDLERSNSELEQFAYVASHDLQEPLRKVASFCELIEARYDDKLDDRGRQYIAFAVDGATRMQALINDLLAFSRVGRLANDESPVDLDRVFATATANLANAIGDAHADVTAPPLPTVAGDATLLTAVFQNLIGNAIKFRREDATPTVAFTVRAEGDEWIFTCADNGIGIDPEYADRIFVIFQRLHPKTTYPGTGIGLAMCRKIIEFHGGRIWLDTDDGTGSRFHFTLPRPHDPES
jgi:signal transduction histidine kinase